MLDARGMFGRIREAGGEGGVNERAAMVRRVFDSTAPRTTTTDGRFSAGSAATITEATVAPAKQAVIPMDDPDLNDREATFQSLRQILENQELIKARLDGITEALGSIATDAKAAATKPAAAAPAAPANAYAAPAPDGGSRQTLWLVDLVPRTIPSRDGGTFTVTSANFSNGWQRDVPKQFLNYFTERVGQQVRFVQQKNDRGFWKIVSVG